MIIYVYFDNEMLQNPKLMGRLDCQMVRGKELFTFEYDVEWLADKRFRQFDPDLQLFGGRQYQPAGKSNFGIFLDSTPDRWGRVLLDRRESARAHSESRVIQPLREWDYLLGVYDGGRMGALRFKLNEDGPFLDNDESMASPPWTSLRELEYASMQLELDENIANNRWLRMLLQPGSSLGGARPKANVIDKNGALWIAKFPSRQDRKDVGAWEMVCMSLADKCGIEVSASQCERLGNADARNYHTFLTKRFDRSSEGKRRHFTSAMTLLGYRDGTSEADGVSYLELAEWIMSNCYDTQRDMEQLFRRIVFNMAVSNCDDHLRNHGFLYSAKGWSLSPAYDLTPDELGRGLRLNVNENDNALDFDLALEIAPYLGIKNAKDIIEQIKKVVRKWHFEASRYGIPQEEQQRVASAFSLCDGN